VREIMAEYDPLRLWGRVELVASGPGGRRKLRAVHETLAILWLQVRGLSDRAPGPGQGGDRQEDLSGPA
jgi:hypothetical protein